MSALRDLFVVVVWAACAHQLAVDLGNVLQLEATSAPAVLARGEAVLSRWRKHDHAVEYACLPILHGVTTTPWVFRLERQGRVHFAINDLPDGALITKWNYTEI